MISTKDLVRLRNEREVVEQRKKDKAKVKVLSKRIHLKRVVVETSEFEHQEDTEIVSSMGMSEPETPSEEDIAVVIVVGPREIS